MNLHQELFVVNGEGEVLEGYDIVSPEAKKAKNVYSNFGNISKDIFTIVFFKGDKCFPDLLPQTATRLIYLSVYIGYETDYLLTSEGIKMNRDKIKTMMLLSESEFKRFISEVTEKGYLIKDSEGYYKLNKEVFFKGHIPDDIRSKNKAFDIKNIKIYKDVLKTLYFSCDIKKHKQLGYIFQIIPYINLTWNVACFNPDEKNRDNIKKITATEFAELVGKDKTHARRLLNSIAAVKFKWKGKTTGFINATIEGATIFVNPMIMYKGNNQTRVECYDLFFNKSN